MSRHLAALLVEVTVPSADDGREFVRRDRIDAISDLLRSAPYGRLGGAPLALVWGHRDRQPGKPFLLVSTHIDTAYGRHFCTVDSGTIRGTLDNSATNAVAVWHMLSGTLDPQVVVAFTGDEERDLQGVDQALWSCAGLGSVPGVPELVVSLDLTEERFGVAAFTVENWFRRKSAPWTRLRFPSSKKFQEYLAERLPGAAPAFISDAEPDESWQYDEHDLNCVSLCLPCRCPNGDMHDDAGVVIRMEDVPKYAAALGALLRRVSEDVAEGGEGAEAEREG